MRKIIQIAGNPCVTALCDDGSIWLQSIMPDENMKPVFSWIRFPDIPEDPAREVFMGDLPDNPNRNKIEDIKWS